MALVCVCLFYCLELGKFCFNLFNLSIETFSWVASLASGAQYWFHMYLLLTFSITLNLVVST